MVKLSYSQLIEENFYSKEDIKNSVLIVHLSKLHKYGLKLAEFHSVFEEGSNFFPLKNKIVDEFGNLYGDSEGFYMSQRVKSLKIKEIIAYFSMAQKMSKKIAYLYEEHLDRDIGNRIEHMRKAIKAKFDNNPDLKTLLMKTGNKEIIEYTYWGDTTFGIDHVTNKGKNILGKLLMEYRDNI